VFDVTPIAVSTSTRVARGEARSRAVDSTRARVPLAALPAGASLKVDMCSRDVVSRVRPAGRSGVGGLLVCLASQDSSEKFIPSHIRRPMGNRGVAADGDAMAGAAGVDNTQRRKWDRDEFAARAREREEREAEAEKRGGKPAPPKRGQTGALVLRDDLRVDNIIQRNYKRDIESRVGTKQIVNPETGAGMGFQCKETGVVLHDSAAYLDHINGKKQMKARGLSMRVERSTVEQVKAKFAQVKKRKAEEAANGGKPKEYTERLAIAEADEETLKARKKAKEAAKKAAKKKAEEEKMQELGGLDPEMAAMMGFSGFGGK